MKLGKLLYFLVLASVLILSGCVARTYNLTRDRVDQDVSSGNQGYLIGKAPVPSADSARKENRTVRVFEVEFGKPYKAKQVDVPLVAQSTVESAPVVETASEGLSSSASSSGQKYTVGKNDTLQKISKKFYGTTKKWTKIYDANKDVLSGPDKLYPGQTLNIPDAGEIKPSAETLSEPKENLK